MNFLISSSDVGVSPLSGPVGAGSGLPSPNGFNDPKIAPSVPPPFGSSPSLRGLSPVGGLSVAGGVLFAGGVSLPGANGLFAAGGVLF